MSPCHFIYIPEIQCAIFRAKYLYIAGQYLSFDDIYIMDYLSRTCLGFLIFVEIITALKHLTFNYYVYLMRMTLHLAAREALSCTISIGVLITAFSSFQYLTLGPYMHLFRDMTSAVITSIRIATAYVKMNIYFETDFADTDLNKIMFVGFFVIVTLIAMNIFISIIHYAMETVKADKVSKSSRVGIYDSRLNAFFWEKVNEIFQGTDNVDITESGKTSISLFF